MNADRHSTWTRREVLRHVSAATGAGLLGLVARVARVEPPGRTGMKVERFAILAALIFASSAALADGIVDSVVKAPITSDGNVAGAPTDLVIDFDRSLDPVVFGRSLLAGCTIK